jgi:hypothetical protein
MDEEQTRAGEESIESLDRYLPDAFGFSFDHSPSSIQHQFDHFLEINRQFSTKLLAPIPRKKRRKK